MSEEKARAALVRSKPDPLGDGSDFGVTGEWWGSKLDREIDEARLRLGEQLEWAEQSSAKIVSFHAFSAVANDLRTVLTAIGSQSIAPDMSGALGKVADLLERAALVRSKLPIDRERVARAIAVAAGDDPDLPSRSQHTLLMRGEGAKIWEEWLPEADAAITAIGSQVSEQRDNKEKPNG